MLTFILKYKGKWTLVIRKLLVWSWPNTEPLRFSDGMVWSNWSQESVLALRCYDLIHSHSVFSLFIPLPSPNFCPPPQPSFSPTPLIFPSLSLPKTWSSLVTLDLYLSGLLFLQVKLHGVWPPCKHEVKLISFVQLWVRVRGVRIK